MGYKTILIPLDGVELDLGERAIKAAQRAAEPHAHLHLLSVVTETPEGMLNSLPGLMGYGGAMYSDGIYAPKEVLDELIRTRKEYLMQVKSTLELEGFKVTTEITAGNAVDSIAKTAMNYVDGQAFDAIVMASHGRTGLNKLLLGSVAEGVLRHTSIPVIIVGGHLTGQKEINRGVAG